MSKLNVILYAGLLALMLAAPAHAQTASPVPLTQYSERPSVVRPPVDNRFAGSISAGTTLNGGNTRAYAGTLSGRFQLIRRQHQLMAEVMGNAAAAHNTTTNQVEDTAKNIVGRVRYDIFVAKNDALFAALAPRWDPYAGLDLRMQMQAGYLRNLYAPADNHRLWLEIGYDGTYDNFTRDVPEGAPELMVELPENDFVHSARVFAGYSNMLTPLATLNLGLEFLYDFEDSDNVRVNSLVELTSSLSARFKLSVLSRILYDRRAVPGRERADYVTTAQLVYTFDSFTPPSPCPACDCSSQVAAARASCQPDRTNSPADAPTAVAPPEDPGAPPLPPPAQPSAPAEPATPAAQAPR
jgi:putative salt-induced outer membrane protein YdiY